jgi:hypothetical protein
MTQQSKAIELLKQLIGEWVVGTAIKTSKGKMKLESPMFSKEKRVN